MPLVNSLYQAKGLFKNGHFSTIYSAKLRPIPRLVQERERLTLPDGDFLDIDWSFTPKPSRKVAILLHGLEGNAQRIYIKGQAKLLNQNGWDAAAMNYRGCSGEDNLLYQTYNAGKSDDLETTIDFILNKDVYDEIVLVGFSLGGSLLLKYLGERTTVPKEIKKGVAISTTLSLKGALESLSLPENWVYRSVFVSHLKAKYRRKIPKFPDKMSTSALKKIKTLLDFDNIYTAPAHGFKDAWEYYEKNSSDQFLPNINVPVLILNARNDSFLSSECFPFEFAAQSKNIYLETPQHGGHVGFHLSNRVYYSEERTLDFLRKA